MNKLLSVSLAAIFIVIIIVIIGMLSSKKIYIAVVAMITAGGLFFIDYISSLDLLDDIGDELVLEAYEDYELKKSENEPNATKHGGDIEPICDGGGRKPGDVVVFKDYPNFRPNLTPAEIFELGSFGGTYWRPIHSSVTGQEYENKHKKHHYLKNIPDNKMTVDFDKYDPKINKYGVHVGQTLEEWEKKGWITKYDPYGWVQWYCNFYDGRRCPDDERQIKRWEGVAGNGGRFKNWLINTIKKKRAKYDDEGVSPKKRQTLQHWAYMITADDV